MLNDHLADRRSKVFYVSTTGCDGWSGQSAAAPNCSESGTGSADGPLATLEEAIRRIRLYRKHVNDTDHFEIVMLPGLYTMNKRVVFTEEDLLPAASSLTVRASAEGEVRLTGGIRLEGFTPHTGSMYKLNLKEAGYSGLRFSQLSCNGTIQRLSRYPKFNPDNPYGSGWLYAEGPLVNMYQGGHGQKDRLTCTDPRIAGWQNLDEIELFIFPRYNWTNNIIRVKSYDPQTGEIVLTEPAAYEIYPGDRFYFQNVKEELSQPGEWYLDEATETLFFYPAEPIECCTVTVPVADHVFELSGYAAPQENFHIEKIDWRDSGGVIQDRFPIGKISDRGNIIIEGITIEDCNESAALFRNVRGCELRGCTIRNTAGPGVIILGGMECRVEGCDIYETGNHGVYMSGGYRSPFHGQQLPCGHAAVNNYIHHVGSRNKASAGIAVNGVGIRITNNLIHDSPRWGILSRGSDNRLEYNHIRHVNIETSDTAAIYLVDRDFGMRGTTIQFNRIHDVLGYHFKDGKWHSPAFAFGIYLDDWTSGVKIYGNIIYRVPTAGIFIHAGQNNGIENNVIAQIREEQVLFQRWAPDMEYRHLGTFDQGLRRNSFVRNVLIGNEETACSIYSINGCASSGGKPDITSNIWEHNLVWMKGEAATVKIHHEGSAPVTDLISWEQWREWGFDHSSVTADPEIEESFGEDYRFAAGSPVWDLGFQEIPAERIGPYPDRNRASWPIDEAAGARERPLV